MPGLDLENIVFDEETENVFSPIIDTNIETPVEDQIDENNLFDGNTPILDNNDDSNNQDIINPNNTSYSIFASALAEEGIFTSIAEEDISKVSSAEDLVSLIDKEVSLRLDEKQRRIDEALNASVSPKEVTQYENVISYLDGLDDITINSEEAEGTTLRENLIYQDFINRGFSEDRAKRETAKSFNAGSDIEDAKEALESVKSFYKDKYKNIITENKTKIESDKAAEITKHKKIETSILKDKEIIPGIELNEATRKQIADNLYKPVHTDKNGNKISNIQKFQNENPEEFMSKLAVIFTLTNGFKDFSKIVTPIVNKETKKAINMLDRQLNNPSNSTGSPSFFNGIQDENSNDTGAFELDIN